MNTDAGSAHGAAAYRGFLFADVRGFTAFAERHGNAAAAGMVGRFLELARKAIARHDGTEVGTEGDAIHAVFPSASSAVLCGLEIVEGAAEANAGATEGTLSLGVGIHAGEAISTAEGYIGRAVNLAARLCAAARPGEVLVSSTVKGITQASIQVGFIPRGRRRLKGIQDPIYVYAVSRDPNARAPRELPRPVMIGVAGTLAAAAVVAVLVLGSSLLPGNPKETPGLTAAPTAPPVVMGPLSIGSYATRKFLPPFTFDVADTGWSANRDVPGLFALVRETTPLGSVYFLRVQSVVESPCVSEPGTGGTELAASEIIPALDALEHIELTNQQPAEVDDRLGQQVDVTVLESALAACGGVIGAEVGVFTAGSEVWSASPGERFRIVTVGVGSQAVTIVMSIDWTQTHSVQELEGIFQMGARLIDTVEF